MVTNEPTLQVAALVDFITDPLTGEQWITRYTAECLFSDAIFSLPPMNGSTYRRGRVMIALPIAYAKLREWSGKTLQELGVPEAIREAMVEVV